MCGSRDVRGGKYRGKMIEFIFQVFFYIGMVVMIISIITGREY